MTIPTDINIADYLEIQNLAYNWADCYDSKDWSRCKTLLGPNIRLDFRYINGTLNENLTPDEYVAIIGDRKVIGDPRVKTQHLIGGGSWSSPGDGTVQVWWQLRVAHVRYAAENSAEAVSKGHGHGSCQHTYEKIDGAWKIVGVTVKSGWIEGDLHATLTPPEE